jgi:hypothetical protein
VSADLRDGGLHVAQRAVAVEAADDFEAEPRELDRPADAELIEKADALVVRLGCQR